IGIMVRNPAPQGQHWHIISEGVAALFSRSFTECSRRIITNLSGPKMLSISINIQKFSDEIVDTLQISPLGHLLSDVAFDKVIPTEVLDILNQALLFESGLSLPHKSGISNPHTRSNCAKAKIGQNFPQLMAQFPL